MTRNSRWRKLADWRRLGRALLHARHTPVLTVMVAAAVLLGYVAWGLQGRIDRLALQNTQLAFENAAYEQAAERVSFEMASLRTTLAELARRTDPNPALDDSVNLLLESSPLAPMPLAQEELDAAGETLDQLHALLGSMDGALEVVRKGVAFREAAADATPAMWPADGWISGGFGYRIDPFTGRRDFHPAVDISAHKGAPVYATGAGRVISASRNGAYGNLVELSHGFGLVTRYGHLSAFKVEVGDTVQRGEIIGNVGATGRATGHHVHYEIVMNGHRLNPQKLVVDSQTVAAN